MAIPCMLKLILSMMYNQIVFDQVILILGLRSKIKNIYKDISNRNHC